MTKNQQVESLIQIDFLPASYRDQHAKRQVNWWRGAVVVIIFGMIVAATVVQWHHRQALLADLEALQPHHAAATALTARRAQLQAEIAVARAEAELVTLVGRSWPRSRVIEAVLAPLPESITLDELSLASERVKAPASPTSGREVDARGKPASESSEHAAVADLRTLQKEQHGKHTVVMLQGIARDVAALHAYLGHVGHHELVVRTELLSIERRGADDDGSEFYARVLVRPPHGHLGEAPARLPSLSKPLALRERSGQQDR